MTIRQYHQQHSLRDEEDLFHSALSDEFDNYIPQSTRPWASRAPANVRETQLFPDLLGQQSPVNMLRASTERADDRSEVRRLEGGQVEFPDGLLEESPSPRRLEEPEGTKQERHAEDLYPANNEIWIEDEDQDEVVQYDLVDDDYYSHMQYSEITKTNPTRYPIDDDGKSVRFKTVAWCDENEKTIVTPTESQEEIDSYRPMHMNYSEDDAGKYYDDNDSRVSSRCNSDDNKSTGTFDRLYDEEYSSIYSTPIDKSERSKCSSYKSPLEDDGGMSGLVKMDAEHSPDSVMDTPSSTSSSFVGDLVFGSSPEVVGNALKVPVDDENAEQSPDELIPEESHGVPTPLRSNRTELAFAAENATPKAEPEHMQVEESVHETPTATKAASSMQVDETPKSNKTETPHSNTTASSSPDFGSDDDSAIQDLARIIQEQQKHHKEATRQMRRVEEPEFGGRMSRLELWQEKQRQREKIHQQQAAANYLPAKYTHGNLNTAAAAQPASKKVNPPKLEPESDNGQEPHGVRYYGGQDESNLFPDMEWDQQGRVIKKARSNQDPQINVTKSDPSGHSYNHSGSTNLPAVSSKQVKRHASPQAYDSIVSNRAAPDRKRLHHSGPNHKVPEELSMLGSYDEGSNNDLVVSDTHSMDDVSVISVDTELRRLAEDVPQKSKMQKQQRLHPYSIKRKDSMESDMRIDDDDVEQQPREHTYHVLKRNDSIEQDMMIDFDNEDQPVKPKLSSFSIDDGGLSVLDYFDDKPKDGNSLVSPPLVRREHFVFSDQIKEEEEEEEDDIMAESDSYSDDSEATNDPGIFPTRAVYQMNLSHHSNKEGCESSDLIERACELLARGLNEDALATLNGALDAAEASIDRVKELMDDHYYNKERALKPPTSEQLLDQEEYEEKLDNDFRQVASEMADIMNNIGVVHELNGDCHLAMNSFRDALDVYRRMCHRYENAGDADVDRAVSNIMHMGIAMRSRKRREELHLEAEDLDEMIKAADDSSERMELRIERLNVLMAVLEVENESLGRNHPTVGFTLLKKGKLHLEMNHVDLAVNDIKQAIIILKEGLGSIHPEVGRALLFLADVFNYRGLRDPITDRNEALKLYEESLIAFSESYGDCNPELGLAHNSMGIIYSSRGENELAMTSYYNALLGYGVRAKGAESPTGRTHPDVAFVWLNVGDLHMECTEWQLALRAYLKAHSCLRGMNEEQKKTLCDVGSKKMARKVLSRGKSGCDDTDALVAFVLLSIAKAQSMLRKYGKSIESLEEALRICRIVKMHCRENRQANNWSKDIARIYENLGEVQLASGNITSAFEYYVESLNQLRSNDSCNNNGIEVALVLGAIGQLHLKRGEYAEATVVLKECMRSFETIGVPQNNRRYKDIRATLVDAELAMMQNSLSTLAGQRAELSEIKYNDRALACDKIADAYKNKDDAIAAIWFYSEALSLRRQKLNRLSGGTRDSFLVDIGKTISTIAELRQKRREFEAAKILLDEAKIFYKSVGLAEEHPFYRDLQDKIEALRKS